MLIHKEMKMADVIHMNHHLLHIINRFNIQLGFEDKTVESICIENHVDPEFFLEIVNTYHDSNYFPLKNLQKFSPSLLVDYLQRTHHFYLGIKIPEIEHFINKLLDETKEEPIPTRLLSDFFLSYKKELTSHIQREEQRVYPYVKLLEEVLLKDEPGQDDLTDLRSYSIQEYEAEHEDVEAKLYDLKNIIIKYLPPPKDSTAFNRILHDLFELERDLNNHGRIENLILVPIVGKMEKTLSQKIRKSNQK
ncbi:MAG: hemerythrin domain-containing protein [Bacteroidales bacterium]